MLPTGLEIELKEKDSVGYIPDADMQRSIAFYTDRFEKSKLERRQKFKFFDDLCYDDDYLLNEEAANSYLREKLNDDEVRINTGTTEKKVEAVHNELVSLNLQPEVRAFDLEDLEIKFLGRDLTDLVMRTNEIEKDDDLYSEALFEFLAQRALFLEEIYSERSVLDKREKKSIFVKRRCEKRILSGLQVFLGDITIPARLFDRQPYIFTYERVSHEEAKAQFQQYPNFDKYVKAGMPMTGDNSTYLYRFAQLKGNEVEILKYQSYPDDEHQIIVNGVPLLEPGIKLPWEHEGYNIKMFVLKPLSRKFAYGRSLVSSAKTLQALDNETIRNMVRKFRQAIEPPTGVLSGKVYSKDIWMPGALVQGASADDFSKLIDHQGVTESEYRMLALIEEKVEEFVGVSKQFQGLETPGDKTATEAVEQLKRALKMLGLSVAGAIRIKREMTFLRIYNILENYTKPMGKKLNPLTNKVEEVYQKFTRSDAFLSTGKRGRKILQFTDRSLTRPEQESIYDLETRLENEGQPTEIRSINVKLLREIPINWYVAVNQKQKEGSALDKAMFTNQVQQAVQLSQIAGRPLNGDKLIEDFEYLWKTKDLFKMAPPMMPGGTAMSMEGTGGNMQQELTENTRAQVRKPSLNTLVSTAQ